MHNSLAGQWRRQCLLQWKLPAFAHTQHGGARLAINVALRNFDTALIRQNQPGIASNLLRGWEGCATSHAQGLEGLLISQSRLSDACSMCRGSHRPWRDEQLNNLLYASIVWQVGVCKHLENSLVGGLQEPGGSCECHLNSSRA